MTKPTRRGARALKVPFPNAWRELLSERLPWWNRLHPSERIRMEELIRLFLVDKTVEGVVGYHPPDEVKLLIVAQACLLVLGLDYGFLDDVTAVVVSPAVVAQRGARHLDGALVSDDHPDLAGQAMLHGPVLLVWDSIRNDATHPERGHNVVFHEFAHKLDMRNGSADGIPPLSLTLRRSWANVMPRMLEKLRSGEPMPLDSYGATNPAEFLAVATEAFFVQPADLVNAEPDLYGLLRDFYGQDPVARFQVSD